MTEHILQFLQYGAPSGPIASVTSSITAPFLPSLSLAASDSPTLMPDLLPTLYSHKQVPRVLAYAGLDYLEIAQSVLKAEAAVNTNHGITAQLEQEHGEKEECNKSWKWDNEDEIEEMDECNLFEVADEKDRVRLAIISLRRRSREFSLKYFSSGFLEKEISQKQEKDEGSLWSNEACLPELLCLVPVAVSRCPTLLTPELLVRGLLSASSGPPLLVTTFTNNPTMVEKGALALANVLGHQSDAHENHPSSSLVPEPTAAIKAVTGSGNLSREHSGAHSQEITRVLTFQYMQRIISVIGSLCQIAPSFAAVCRDALVNSCTLAEMVLYITVEMFHDELQFLSKLVFLKERTSRWILSFLGSNQKHGDSQCALISLRSLSRETDASVDTKGTPSNTKGVAIRVRESLLADAKLTWKAEGWCGKLHAHLRLYCVLIRAGDLQPMQEEIDFWIRALAGTRDNSTAGDSVQSVKGFAFVSERTLELGICFVCLVPGLTTTRTLLHACIANLLRAAMGNAPYSTCTPEIELSVWVAVQLLLRRFADITGLVREALGMHVSVHTGSMRDLADAAVAAGVLSDPFIATSAAAALRPSGPIPSPKKQQCLGLKCLEQLLNTSTVARCAVDISDTVMHYICIAGEPIHPVLPSIVQGYTELSVSVPRARGGLPRFRMRPFSRASIVEAMAPGFALLRNNLSAVKICDRDRLCGRIESQLSHSARDLHRKDVCKKNGNGDPLATAALVTYYILQREQIARQMGISGGSNHVSPSSAFDGDENCWWLDLLGALPLREMLMYMEVNWPAYEHLLPQWLCVASSVFPERFTAQALLHDLEKTDTSGETHVKGVSVAEDLDWLGPPHATVRQDNEEEKVVAPPIKTDPPAGSSQGNQPEVVPVKVDSPTGRTPMHIDTGQQDASLCSSADEPGQNINAEASFTDSDIVKFTACSDLFSLEPVTMAMRNAVQSPLPALRILHFMMANPKLVTGKNVTENLEILAGLEVDCRLEAAMMKELIPNLLNSSCPRCLQDQFCSWWRNLPISTLEYLVPVLVDLIKDPSRPNCGDYFSLSEGLWNAQPKQSGKRLGPPVPTLSKCGLAEEPLKLLACNARVFRTSILSIVLDLLLELLAANRRICQVAASDGGRDAGIKREEVAAAIVAQDSAVCQILLEACLSKKELGDEELPGPLLEARSLICATICSILHTSPLLLKLLHFQGYDMRLIPMMVEGVPAMVQCLEFIGELLQQSQQQRQVFAIVLTAHLTSLHPDLPQSLTAAQQVVNQVTQVRTKVAGCAAYLQEVLGAVAQCACTFPSLATPVVALLQSCAQAGGPLTRAGPPRDAALHDAAVAAFKHLIQSKLLHGRPPPASNWL